MESAVPLCGWKYKHDSDMLFISARKVPVSPLFDEGTYETSMELGLIENVFLGGELICSYDN